jgi:transposase InsO family protein
MHRNDLSVELLCDALGVPRSSWYRWKKPAEHQNRGTSHRRLSAEDETYILATVNSERFCDMSPGEIHATLLDEGVYLCSERTMYRILERNSQNRQRRQSCAKNYKKPELLATKPNELWSWDITKLKGPAKWTYFYLYKIIDVFSRYVVGWTVAFKESALLAEELIGETCLKQEIVGGQLTIHADNGSSMTSGTVGMLLTDLGITKTHSRPYTSNDNPFSESAFKTLKYRPGFPERFMTIEEARCFCKDFFDWYNNEHRHSGIAMLTPESVHYGTYQQILEKREIVLMDAYMNHPERFVKGVPNVEQLPQEVWINKPEDKKDEVLARQ